jgi:hypothetical protein
MLPPRSSLDLEIDRAWWLLVTAPDMDIRVLRAQRMARLRRLRLEAPPAATKAAP